MFTVSEIKELIKQHRTADFYNDRTWRKLSAEIRREQNNECQICKSKGKVSPAEIVHHVKHLKTNPELAYSRKYLDENGQEHRQLICVCFECHEQQHPERRWKNFKKKFTNRERW